jgi:dTDP-4-dehydrorhamnose reductase
MVGAAARAGETRMITVIGSSGQLGTALHRILGDSATFVDFPDVDITNPQSVEDAVEGASTVINAAAYTDVDGAEADEARALAVNGTGPQNLARACARTGATLLHVSTDYVFDGSATSPIRSRPEAPMGGRRPPEKERFWPPVAAGTSSAPHGCMAGRGRTLLTR